MFSDYAWSQHNLWALNVLVDHVEGTDKVIDTGLGDHVIIPGRGWGLLLYFMLRSVLNSSHVMDIGYLSPEVNLLDDGSVVVGFTNPVWICSMVCRYKSDPFRIMEACFIEACSMMRYLYTNSVSCFEHTTARSGCRE